MSEPRSSGPAPEPAVPPWLHQRLRAAGGAVPFSSYMDWVLHDPEFGAYGSGRLRLGPAGDFVTSPSLGPDFAALLAPQLAQWLQQLAAGGLKPSAAAAAPPLALVEAGPGEGSLALDLAKALAQQWPDLAQQLELVLVEANAGMAARQRQLLRDCPIPVRWSDLDGLARAPVRGVLLAHELLDALPVERIVWSEGAWRHQLVRLQEDAGQGPSLRLEPGGRLSAQDLAQLEPLGLLEPQGQRPEGWCTEWHRQVGPWLAASGAGIEQGVLLVVDYALEAWRYYAPQRSQGTLMAYRRQQASPDPLREPGHWDLTAHLCIDSLVAAAGTCGWQLLGQGRQGEALLALGLAQRLHGLQQLEDQDLAEALARREALLRLVAPGALGDFRWLAFSRGVALEAPRFSQEPGPPASH